MTIHRMTFDVAVKKGAPDVYSIQSDLIVAMRKVGCVVGAEGVGNCRTTQSFEASEAINKQIADGYPIDISKKQISAIKGEVVK